MKFKVEKLPAAESEISALEQSQKNLLKTEYEKIEQQGELIMKYVYVKDSDGYVCKKLEAELTSDEKIITEEEYMKISGRTAYQKEFGHGGTRKNAGRKQKFGSPLKFQIRVTQEEKDFIAYAREHHISYTAMMK